MTTNITTQQTVSRTAAGALQVRVDVGGEVDLSAIAALQAALDHAAAVDGVSQVVVDLAAVSFLDSSGIGVLVAAHRHAAAAAHSLTVVDATGMVRRVLDIAGVLNLLTGAAEPTGSDGTG